MFGILDGLGEVGQSISHLSSSDIGRGVLESLEHDGLVLFLVKNMIQAVFEEERRTKLCTLIEEL